MRRQEVISHGLVIISTHLISFAGMTMRFVKE
jgi:hypothetical protein